GERELRVNTGVPLELCLLGTGFSYTAPRREWEAAVVGALIGRVRDIRRMGSAALDLCSVAAGRLDLYYERGLNPWDHAAGALIAREAGARVGGFGGARESTELIIACAPDLYDTFEPLLARIFADHPDGGAG
ncbi:MAG: inositol monophosphatase family protein, partial [Cryobacterium sp.]